MTNLNSRKSVHPNWQEWAGPALEGFAVCVFAIYDKTPHQPAFTPYAFSGAPTPTELWRGRAQVQVYRQTLTVDDVAGAYGQIRSVRIEVARNEPNAPIRKGLIGRVVSCELNHSLEDYEYVISSGLTSGLAFTRNIEAEVDMGVIADWSGV